MFPFRRGAPARGVTRDDEQSRSSTGAFAPILAGVAAGALPSIGRASRPSLAGPRAQLLEAVASLPASPSLVLTCLAFGALVAPAFGRRPGRISSLFWPLALALPALPFLLPELIWPFDHFRARVLNAALALLWLWFIHGRTEGRLAAPRVAPSSPRRPA